MGTGFTVDTPVHVAHYGISSVISLVDDVLIEQMRKYHAERIGEDYSVIPDSDRDARAKRITAYLDLLDRIVTKNVEELKSTPFEPGSEITRYYEMLPECSLKDDYKAMLKADDSTEKEKMQDKLRAAVVPGSIDVNVMTKLDCTHFEDGEALPSEFSDAHSALRGFAKSGLSASIVCSAGMNRGFYGYMSDFDDFYPDEKGRLKKKIVLKVSDFRSAEVQGTFLAKRGIWVSEYRIESGLNCGGHAFATKGLLLGPIMDEFKMKRDELKDKLFNLYLKGLEKIERPAVSEPFTTKITVQGGIGTSSENDLLFQYYKVDGTGWGTPFLLVPEVVNIDEEHVQKLIDAGEDDVWLSTNSPLGIPFWNLRTSASEIRRKQNIADGKPGSVCKKGYLKLDTTFTEKPICTASRAYQQKRLASLELENLAPEAFRRLKELILSKSCICHDLAGSATRKIGTDPDAATAVCTGPNIVNFAKIASLQEMVDHIYGRISLLTTRNRPHMFTKELMIYVDYLKDEFEQSSNDMTRRTKVYLTEFRENLLEGIDHYRELAEDYIESTKEAFLEELNELKAELETIHLEPVL